MARPLRIYLPGTWYRLTARANERRGIFQDDTDRELFLIRMRGDGRTFRRRTARLSPDEQPFSSAGGPRPQQSEPGDAVAERQLQPLVQSTVSLHGPQPHLETGH